MSKGIVIKDEEVSSSLLLVAFDPTLVALVEWLEVKYGIYFTQGFRKKSHPYDVHSVIPCRGIDCRSRIYNTDKQTADQVADDINKNWEYDPHRPNKKCCVFHAKCPKCGTSNKAPFHAKCSKCDRDITDCWHFHLQSHPNTTYIGDTNDSPKTR